MRPNEREAWERRIHDLWRQGEVGTAVEVALSAYRPEYLKLLNSILHDRERSQEAYSSLSEALLRDLPAFRWECSFRTWSYRVARNVGYRLLASPMRREQPVSHGAFAHEVQPERSGTDPWLRTQVKDHFRALREQLHPHEQRILTLRVDQRMSWTEVARAMAGSDESLNTADLMRRATVLRQQFQRIKNRLRELAEQDGLLSQEDQPL
ncbi:RNA polymerase sigma-70 factor, ECF subfamily [Stigmatella aurantiaca]|uniref:RNA polymerase sigma-70 factor, ECF subfamily n=1 Tax=Stigmatella aurantiaca TaxID=41 RepID=A0A1H7WXZ8_STIAU|nr:sigma-70 family RNA polymerase sigma factor [Stigmatella aurantiaca]SEM26184.1 RNA polymerase sigma-70 factor, ECF subfamily [Stigmatella aurantiaca]